MPPFLHLLALAAIAIFSISISPVPVNALVADRAQVARHVHAAHDVLGRRKRDSPTGRCKTRPSSPTPTPTSAPPTSVPPTSAPPSPTSSSSSTSSAPPSVSTPTNSGSKKWGLAWGADPTYLKNFIRPNVKYFYNWNPIIPKDASDLGLVPAPMLWGAKSIGDFQQNVVQGYANVVLGMNEPNIASQSNLSPDDAFNMWMQYIVPLKALGYTLVSPACTDDDTGKAFYARFMQLCQANSACHVDAIAFHSYVLSAQHLIDYAEYLHSTYGLPIWITEFADQNYSGVGGQAQEGDVWDYASKVRAYVNAADHIQAAFPFGIMQSLPNGVNSFNQLLDPTTGYPTPLAYYYFG